jgi:mono/diheme cytochrome c family protein
LKTISAVIALGIAASLMSSAFGQTGADTYKSKCQMCHAADGTGSTPAGKSTKTPSFLDADLVKMSDTDLITGTKNGKGKMPAYAGKLTDPQIKDVVAYIRTLQKK